MYLWRVWGYLTSESEEIKDTIDRVLLKKQSLDAKRPFPSIVIHRLKEDLSTEWTYHSNSIEGNSLSLRETRVVLLDGITIGGKSMREHFETINHARGIEHLESLITPSYQIKSADILELHAIVMKNIDDTFGGRIRNGQVRISGANFIPPASGKVSMLLDELIHWVNTNPQQLDVITLSAIFHHRFVWIHPFFDGNGRTVRLAMNLILMKNGHPPAIILRNDRSKYYSALNLANTGNYKKIILMMAQSLERSLNIYNSALDDSGEQYLPIANIVKDPAVPYGQEYVSLLARTGKIDAYKEGRNWYTSKFAVLQYANE